VVISTDIARRHTQLGIKTTLVASASSIPKPQQGKCCNSEKASQYNPYDVSLTVTPLVLKTRARTPIFGSFAKSLIADWLPLLVKPPHGLFCLIPGETKEQRILGFRGKAFVKNFSSAAGSSACTRGGAVPVTGQQGN
jgi:hypothetical protein